MKLAILGTGMIVKEVLPVLQTIEGISLHALLSTQRSLTAAEALATQYGIGQVTAQYDEILANPQIDTVYVAVPNHLHYDYAKAALLAGKHVICEKPFTLTVAHFEELVSLAEENGCLLFEAITNQYLENATYLKEQLDKLGDIKLVTCQFSQYSSRYDAFKRGEVIPAFDPNQGGGALRDLNIYNIHLVVGLFGQPKQVTYLPNMERGVDTSGVLTMDYGSFKAVCIGAKDSTAPMMTSIQGNKGSLVVNGPTNSLPSVTVMLAGQEAFSVNQKGQHHRMYQEFVAFEDMISRGDIAAAQEKLSHSRIVMTILGQAASVLA